MEGVGTDFKKVANQPKTLSSPAKVFMEDDEVEMSTRPKLCLRYYDPNLNADPPSNSEPASALPHTLDNPSALQSLVIHQSSCMSAGPSEAPTPAIIIEPETPVNLIEEPVTPLLPEPKQSIEDA